jgi:antitoxin FitA
MTAMSEGPMATLTIRNVDAAVKERLRVRAAQHGRSMEAEIRSILSEAVAEDRDRPELNLAEAIRRRFAPLGGATTSSRTRRSRVASCRSSSGDRPRHQRPVGINAVAHCRGGLRLGRGAAESHAPYDRRQ